MKAGRVAPSIIGLLGTGCIMGCQLVAGIEDLSLEDAGRGEAGGVDGGPALSDSGGTEGGGDVIVGDAADGGEEASPGEGEAPLSDSGGRDAEADGTLGEGGGDASLPTEDAPSPVDAPSTSGFCASRSPAPTFCQDFDEGPLPGNFSGESTVNGTLSLSKASVVSAPYSLLAQDNALGACAGLNTALRNFFPALPTAATTFTLDFEIDPLNVDPNSGAALVVASLDFGDAANERYSIQLTLFQQGVAGSIGIRLEEQAAYADGGTFYEPHALQNMPSGAWTEVVLEVNLAPASATATVNYGSTPVLSDAPLTISLNPTNLMLTIGSAYESTPSSGWTTGYDNVALNIGH
jgi:hypothetical protein